MKTGLVIKYLSGMQSSVHRRECCAVFCARCKCKHHARFLFLAAFGWVGLEPVCLPVGWPMSHLVQPMLEQQSCKAEMDGGARVKEEPAEGAAVKEEPAWEDGSDEWMRENAEEEEEDTKPIVKEERRGEEEEEEAAAAAAAAAYSSMVVADFELNLSKKRQKILMRELDEAAKDLSGTDLGCYVFKRIEEMEQEQREEEEEKRRRRRHEEEYQRRHEQQQEQRQQEENADGLVRAEEDSDSGGDEEDVGGCAGKSRTLHRLQELFAHQKKAERKISHCLQVVAGLREEVDRLVNDLVLTDEAGAQDEEKNCNR